MSERLRHLQRQQLLLREHLDWIEKEIARETAARTPPSAPSATDAAPPPDGSETIGDEADALLERYGSQDREDPAALRTGCIVAFAATLLLLAASLALIWFVFYRKSGG